MHGTRALQVDRRLIAVVSRIEHDHLVPRPHHGGDGGKHGFRRARSDSHLGIRAHPATEQTLGLARNGLTQRGHADAGRILILAIIHGLGERVT